MGITNRRPPAPPKTVFKSYTPKPGIGGLPASFPPPSAPPNARTLAQFVAVKVPMPNSEYRHPVAPNGIKTAELRAVLLEKYFSFTEPLNQKMRDRTGTTVQLQKMMVTHGGCVLKTLDAHEIILPQTIVYMKKKPVLATGKNKVILRGPYTPFACL